MRKIVSCVLFAMLLSLLGPANEVRAGVVGSALGEMGASEQTQNAGDALQNELTAWATKGRARAVRGASSALGDLALNSGDLICNAWIISFRVHIRNMIIENAGLRGTQRTEHLQLIKKAQDFAEQLELECAKVGLLGKNPATGGGGTGGAGAGEEMQPEPKGPAQTIDRRPGETVADAICRHRCQPYLDRLTEERRWMAEAEKWQREAEAKVKRASAGTARQRTAVAKAQKELKALNEITSVSYDTGWPQSRKDEWTNAQARSPSIKSGLKIAEGKLQQAVKAEQGARDHLKIMQRAVVSQRKRVQAAQAAYDDCLRRCLKQAADAGDPTTISCPEPAAHKSVSVGPNDKVGSSAQLGQDIKKSLGGGAGLGGLLGGGGGGTFGSKKPNPVPNRAGGGKQPKTVDDPIDDDNKVAQEIGDTELEVGAMLVGDGLLVSAHIDEAPGDGTFQAVFLEDARGRRMTPDRYEIYDLWREWTLNVWWTYDRWVDGQHVEHREGGWTESGRETMQIAALQPGSAGEEGIWNRLGFSSAAKGVQTLGAHFALKPEDLAEPVDLVIHTTLPEEDPVTTQPVVYRLSMENGSKVKLDPVTTTLAQARDCY